MLFKHGKTEAFVTYCREGRKKGYM